MTRTVLLMSVALTVGFAPAPLRRSERRPHDPFREIVGRYEAGGTKLTISRNRFTHSDDYNYEMILNPNASPATFDLRGIGRQNAGWEFTGIYKVVNGELHLCYVNGKGPRPTTFEGKGGGYSRIYKRVGP
jgi:uncharacterized protein (TIGR03067 family)